MLRYSKIDTEKLAIDINKTECLVYLNKLIIDEGCLDEMPVFENNEVVINMDCVEKLVAKSENRKQLKSMDSSFVIGNDQILLTEFRFNYKKMSNLNREELFGKVLGSKNALNNSQNIHNQYFFIFNSNLKYQAIRRFRNMVPSMPNEYIAIDILDFKNMFF